MNSMAEIGARIRTQDNLATAEPIFTVQQRNRLYWQENTDAHVWVDVDFQEVDADTAARLEANYEATGATHVDRCSRVGIVDHWEFVTACFTRDAAQRYIDENAHHMTEPRIFVESGYRNHEWIAVRAFLKGC